MLSIKGLINTSLGFKPYNIGNQVGWIKTVKRPDGYTSVFKKLPTGTVLKHTIDSKGIIWTKRGLFSNGNEMQSYICDSLGSRAIHITKPKSISIFAQTKKYYDFKTKQYLPNIYNIKQKHLYSLMDKIKMHIGMN